MSTTVPWITTADKVVGSGHLTLPDVANRVMRFVFDKCGLDYVTYGFTGFVPVFKPEAYGAVGDGVTDDGAAIVACVAAAASVPKGGTVVLSAKKYNSSVAIALPTAVNFRGAGKFLSELHFTGATNGVTRLYGSADTRAGYLEHLYITGVYGTSLVGADYLNVFHAHVRHVCIEGWTTHTFRCLTFDHIYIDSCIFNKGGDATHSGVRLDTGATPAFTSTGLHSVNTWYNAGTQAKCNLQIERTLIGTVIGGVILSGNIGLFINAEADGLDGRNCSNLSFIGVDFENCAHKYVQVGTVWSGAGGSAAAIYGLHFSHCNFSLSGSANSSIGYELANVFGFTCEGQQGVLNGPGVAFFDFLGTNNRGIELGKHGFITLGGGTLIRWAGVAQTNINMQDHVIIGKLIADDIPGGAPSIIARNQSSTAAIAIHCLATPNGKQWWIYTDTAGTLTIWNATDNITAIQVDRLGNVLFGNHGIGFFGGSVATQPTAITATPGSISAGYVQAEVQGLKTSIDDIATKLHNLHLTA